MVCFVSMYSSQTVLNIGLIQRVDFGCQTYDLFLTFMNCFPNYIS